MGLSQLLQLLSLIVCCVGNGGVSDSNSGWVGRPNLEAESTDVFTIVLAVHANDLLVIGYIKVAPLSLLRVLTLEILLQNDSALLVEEAQAVNAEFDGVLQYAHSADNLLIVYVDAS